MGRVIVAVGVGVCMGALGAWAIFGWFFDAPDLGQMSAAERAVESIRDVAGEIASVREAVRKLEGEQGPWFRGQEDSRG